MTEHLSKYPKLMPGLALIFHLVELADKIVTPTQLYSRRGRHPLGRIRFRFIAPSLLWNGATTLRHTPGAYMGSPLIQSFKAQSGF